MSEESTPTQVGHTPGPWRVETLHLTGEPTAYFVIKDSITSLLRMNGPCAMYSNAEADARLIAAAPDLLQALKAVDATCPCDPDINERFQAAWDMLKAAIARAEGR